MIPMNMPTAVVALFTPVKLLMYCMTKIVGNIADRNTEVASIIKKAKTILMMNSIAVSFFVTFTTF